MKITARTKARNLAAAVLSVDFEGKDAGILTVAERVEEGHPEIHHLSFDNLLGAVRAAARRLGRKVTGEGANETIEA
jgi:hypothetical protein